MGNGAASATGAPRPENDRARRLVDEIVADALGLLNDRAGIGDLKIVAASVREMREAFRLFAPFAGTRKVSTFGSARVERDDPTYRLAVAFSRHIADAGFMVITGGGPGIMEACQLGAGRERSFGVNIQLPFEQEPNQIINGDPKLMSFKYFFVRKLIFIKEAEAAVFFPGGFGTHDEGFETLTLLQTGKSSPFPVVFLDVPGGTYWKTWRRYVEEHILRRGMISRDDMALFKVTDRVEEAVREITDFYRVYHSSRYVRETLVLRLQRPVPGPWLERLAAEFGDLLDSGKFAQRAAYPIEQDEPAIWHLPRLAFHFNRSSLGRLRMLIDRLNEAPAE